MAGTTKQASKRTAKRVTAPKPDPRVIRAAESVIDGQRTAYLGNQEQRGVILYDTAKHFHAVVLTDKVMTQNRYADLFYGTRTDKGDVVENSATAMATLLKRLADAAVRLGVERDSDEWRWLVQNGTSAVGGQHVKESAKGKALTILRRNTREFAKTGKNGSATRKAGGNANQNDKVVTDPAKRPPTPDEFLTIVGQFVRKMDRADRGAYCARLRTVVAEVEKELAAPGSNRSPRTGQAAKAS